MNRITRLNLATLLIAFLSTVHVPICAAVDSNSGEVIYKNTCQACHGVNAEGSKALSGPRLAGQHGSYLLRQMAGFRDGFRGANPSDQQGRIMAAMVQTLSDEQFEQVVEYILGLKANRPMETLTGGDVKRGQKSYGEVCVTCHGTQGQGVRSVRYLKQPAARLAGQHDWYLLGQLKNFKHKIRGTHKDDKYGVTMRTVLLEFNREQELLDIVTYIQTME